MVLKVPAGSSRLTLVLLAVVMATCAGCSILLYALADVTRQSNPAPAALDSREIDPPQIMFARDKVGRLALIGTRFEANEPVIVWYSPSPITTTEELVTVTVAYTNGDGTFSQLLADLRTRVPEQGWFVAQGRNSGGVAPLISYSPESTATPLPTLTMTPTPTTANTPMPTATSTQPPTVPPTIVPSPTLNPNPFEGWYAEYYDNRDLAGEPFYTRNEYPDGEWMCVCEISAEGRHPLNVHFQREQFSARWTGTFSFTNDNYQFMVRVMDGVRISVDGVPIINDWRFSSKPRDLMRNWPMSQGKHTIEIEYFNAKGKGLISVKWYVAYPDWEARYYNTINLDGPVIFKRNDGEFSGPLLNTDGSPAPGVNADNFSVYWSRRITLKNSGTYRFTGWADDGVRIFIDDKEVFRQNTSSNFYNFEFPLALRSGTHTIQIHYYDVTGNARMELNWNWVPPTPTPEPTPVL